MVDSTITKWAVSTKTLEVLQITQGQTHAFDIRSDYDDWVRCYYDPATKMLCVRPFKPDTLASWHQKENQLLVEKAIVKLHHYIDFDKIVFVTDVHGNTVLNMERFGSLVVSVQENGTTHLPVYHYSEEKELIT
jgi:hypothetical protein